MKKIVIFASGNITLLATHLEKGTPNFTLIDKHSLSSEEIKTIEEMFPKRIEETKASRMERKAVDALSSRNTELVLVERRALKPEHLQNIERMAKETYSDTVSTMNILIPSTEYAEPLGKETFFISGNEDAFRELSNLIVKGTPTSEIISGHDMSMKMVDKTFITAVNNISTNLLVVNTSKFSKDDTAFYTRVGTVGDNYVVYELKIVSERTNADQDEQPQLIGSNNLPGQSREKNNGQHNSENPISMENIPKIDGNAKKKFSLLDPTTWG